MIKLDSIELTLRECGVTASTLSTTEKEALDREGYVIFRNVIDADWLKSLRAAFDDGCAKDSSSPVNAVVKDSGTRHLDNLVTRGEKFERVYTHPLVLAGVWHVLQVPFRLAQMNGREPLPGYGQQGLHADWTARAKGEPFRIVTSIWLLDNFTSENGATRVVPGTHRLLTRPPKSFADPQSRHRDQRIISAPAGSVLLFNGHLWHSGTRNQTSLRRRVLQCSFVGRDELRFNAIKVNAPECLAPAARCILGL
ncbi:MAG TPA: phytanoyl-CoA dioxygenase family protein [Blastocatellia bacterium]|nr:phytanoyl-CoA dioxygenase family protein [Blastocatellia bacterium]